MIIFILKIIYWFIATILVLKIVSNLLLPIALSKKEVINKETGETGGISIMPAIDIFSLGALLILSSVINEDGLYKVKTTAFVFGGAIVVSFVVAFIVAGFIGWRRSK